MEETKVLTRRSRPVSKQSPAGPGPEALATQQELSNAAAPWGLGEGSDASHCHR